MFKDECDRTKSINIFEDDKDKRNNANNNAIQMISKHSRLKHKIAPKSML